MMQYDPMGGGGGGGNMPKGFSAPMPRGYTAPTPGGGTGAMAGPQPKRDIGMPSALANLRRMFRGGGGRRR